MPRHLLLANHGTTILGTPNPGTPNPRAHNPGTPNPGTLNLETPNPGTLNRNRKQFIAYQISNRINNKTAIYCLSK